MLKKMHWKSKSLFWGEVKKDEWPNTRTRFFPFNKIVTHTMTLYMHNKLLQTFLTHGMSLIE